MILDATDKSIEIVLGEARVTNNLPVNVSFKYVDTSCLLTPQQQVAELGGANDTNTNGTTPVTILSAPSAPDAATLQYQKVVTEMSVVNEDTVPHTVTIRLNHAGVYRTYFQVTLAVGDQLQYSEE